MKSIFDISGYTGDSEIFEDILKKDNIRIERILSSGQTSPETGWYDQEEHEFVLLLQGKAVIEFEDQEQIELNAGEYLNIPAHKKHRVAYTSKDPVCIWIAVFYR